MDWWAMGTVLAQTLDVMRWAWPLGAVLLGAVLFSTGMVIAQHRRLPPPPLAWPLVLILNPVAMAAVAGLRGCRNCTSTSTGGWTVYAAGGLLLAQLLLACWSTWRADGWRACTGTLHALLIWPATCTALVILTMS